MHLVAPFTGAWIEICTRSPSSSLSYVAPFTGAWIEIYIFHYQFNKNYCRSLHGSVDWNSSYDAGIVAKAGRSLHGSVDWNCIWLIAINLQIKSLPSRERGLKLVWISCLMRRRYVAPFTGAWIEIRGNKIILLLLLSLPSRERGLKSKYLGIPFVDDIVAPFTGAWIEIKWP